MCVCNIIWVRPTKCALKVTTLPTHQSCPKPQVESPKLLLGSSWVSSRIPMNPSQPGSVAPCSSFLGSSACISWTPGRKPKKTWGSWSEQIYNSTRLLRRIFLGGRDYNVYRVQRVWDVNLLISLGSAPVLTKKRSTPKNKALSNQTRQVLLNWGRFNNPKKDYLLIPWFSVPHLHQFMVAQTPIGPMGLQPYVTSEKPLVLFSTNHMEKNISLE